MRHDTRTAIYKIVRYVEKSKKIKARYHVKRSAAELR